MNSLDAIIATVFLLTSFAILLGVVNEQAKVAENTRLLVESKGEVLFCTTVYDIVLINDAEYLGEPKCFSENKKIIFEGKAGRKETDFLGGDSFEHYLQWSNIFD